MKKQAPRFLLLFPIAAALSAAAASTAALFEASPNRPLLLAAAFLSLAAAGLGTAAILQLRRISTGMDKLEEAKDASGSSVLDIARYARVAAQGCDSEPSSFLGGLLENLNEDLALLQRSAVKFDLFSSDILFSAQNLAGLATKDLDALTRLRKNVEEFFGGQSRTNDELKLLRERLADSATLAGELTARADQSRSELSALVALSRDAVRDAKDGERDVSATGSAAVELERGLVKLTDTARREAVEADRIAESLAGIADIVERTHILATNASIEAVRAGSRGSGFAVIAQEVRKLADSSRHTLEDIDKVLESVMSGIRESSGLVSQVSSSADKLGKSLGRTRAAFDAIGGRIQEVESRLESFDGVFAEQREGSARSSSSAEEAAALLEGFTKDFLERAVAYEAIMETSRDSEASAHDAQRSARVLAQLAGYLKNGGSDRNRVLRKYKVDDDAVQLRLGRKERREELLYNLDAFSEDGQLLGYLGDLSHSGLLLVADRPFETGTRIRLRVALPISAEGERSVALSVVVRRCEADCSSFRLGCSIEVREDSARQIEDILQSLSLGAVAAPDRVAAPTACADTADTAETAELEEI